MRQSQATARLQPPAEGRPVDGGHHRTRTRRDRRCRAAQALLPALRRSAMPRPPRVGEVEPRRECAGPSRSARSRARRGEGARHAARSPQHLVVDRVGAVRVMDAQDGRMGVVLDEQSGCGRDSPVASVLVMGVGAYWVLLGALWPATATMSRSSRAVRIAMRCAPAARSPSGEPDGTDRTAPVAAAATPPHGACDLVIVATKSHDTLQAAATLRPARAVGAGDPDTVNDVLDGLLARQADRATHPAPRRRVAGTATCEGAEPRPGPARAISRRAMRRRARAPRRHPATSRRPSPPWGAGSCRSSRESG